MKRRRFLGAIPASALAATAPARLFAAEAMKRVAVLAFVDLEPERENPGTFARFFDAMYVKPFAAAGLRDGVSIRLVPHVIPMLSKWGETAPQAIREIVNAKYDGAVVEGGYLTRRLQEAAPNLPIAAYLFDPVGEGFATSLARPGGTVSGAHRGVREVFLKQIEVLRRLVPGTTRMAWISFRPQLEERWHAFSWAAREAGVSVRQVILDPTKGNDFPDLVPEFEALRKEGYRCGLYNGGLEFSLKAVTTLALRHRIALSYWGPPEDFEREGLLLQYRSLRDGVEASLAATMAKILRGQHPSNIPFEGPTRFQMRINLKTAERIGVKVPQDVLVMADEVLR